MLCWSHDSTIVAFCTLLWKVIYLRFSFCVFSICSFSVPFWCLFSADYKYDFKSNFKSNFDSVFVYEFESEFKSNFESNSNSNFESNFKSDFESYFESDFRIWFLNLILLSYSMPIFSANLFGLLQRDTENRHLFVIYFRSIFEIFSRFLTGRKLCFGQF